MLTLKIIFRDKNDQLRGSYDSRQNTIYIQRSLPWLQKIEVFVHEILHWIISSCIRNAQTNFEINWKYDLFWAKMFSRDRNWVMNWYENQAKICGLKPLSKGLK